MVTLEGGGGAGMEWKYAGLHADAVSAASPTQGGPQKGLDVLFV